MVKTFNGFDTLIDYLNSLKPSSPTGSLVYNTLTDLQNEYPSGSTQPAWVIADEEWYYWTGAIIPPDTTPPVITCSSSGGTFSSSQTVTLSSNETATIYYTLDGSTPTTSSSVYSSPLTISSTSTLKFFGKDIAGNSSAIQSVSFTINAVDTTPPTITISPVGGTYTSTQTVTLSANETAAIYYTTDGSTPTTSSAVYSSPITVSSSETIKYFGKDSAGNSSTVQSAVYTINLDTTPPVITASPVAGTYTGTQNVTLSSNESGTTIYYTTDGSTPTTSSTVYTTPIAISATTTLQYIGKDASGNISTPVASTYTIQANTSTVYDSFNRTNSTTTLGNADTGQTWTASNGNWGISSNMAYPVSGTGGTTDFVAVIESGKADTTVQATFSTLAGTNSRLVFRYTDISNYWIVQSAGASGYQLFKRVGGTFSAVGTQSPTTASANGDVIKVVLSGSSIQVLVNGVQRYSVTDTVNQTATQHGIGTGGVSYNVARFDEFSIA